MRDAATTAEKLRAAVAGWRERLPGEIAAEVTSIGRNAVTAPWPAALDPRLVRALRGLGIEQPWSHQAEAWARLARGEDVGGLVPRRVLDHVRERGLYRAG